MSNQSSSSSHEYAARRALQRVGQLLESIAIAFDIPVWVLNHEGRVMHKSLPGPTACEFIHSYDSGMIGCHSFHHTTMQELSAFREPVVKNCYMGLGKIVCPLRIENVLVGAVAVFPVCIADYSPASEQQLDAAAEALGVARSPELDNAMQNVRVLSPIEMQRIVRLLTALSEEIASSSFELADTVTELVSTYDELALLYRMSQMVGRETAVDNICELTMQEITQMLKPRRAFLMLMNASLDRLEARSIAGVDVQAFDRLRLNVGEGIVGQSVLSGEGIIRNHITGDPIQAVMGRENVESIAVVPLKMSDRTLGVIVVADKISGEEFRANDLKFIQALAGPTTVALENARLNEERIRSERELAWSSIAFAAAHKIGNALFGLEGYVRRLPELLRTSPPDTEGVTSAMAGAQHTVNSMKRIIQEFKDFSRADQLKRSSVDLNLLLHKVSGQWIQEDSPWRVERRFDPELPHIHADADRLEQIFGELIENATHAMPEGGTLTLATSRATQESLDHFGFPHELRAVRVDVSDTGGGIAPENKDHVFDSFYTTRGTGTGLGLAIVRKYVELHGGRIVENGYSGQGANFCIVLPVQ